MLNTGETAIPGMPERVAELRAAGKRVLMVSNAARFPHAALMETCARLGHDFAPDDAVTRRATMLAALNGARTLHWDLVATRATGLHDLEGLYLTCREEARAPCAQVDGFLVVGSAACTRARQTLREEALTALPRRVFVANPGIVAQRERGVSTKPGHFAHRLADRTGARPRVFGKPDPDIDVRAFVRLAPASPRAHPDGGRQPA